MKAADRVRELEAELRAERKRAAWLLERYDALVTRTLEDRHPKPLEFDAADDLPDPVRKALIAVDGETDPFLRAWAEQRLRMKADPEELAADILAGDVASMEN